MLHLLNATDQELRHITTTYDISSMKAVRFSPDGQTILVFWDKSTVNQCCCDIHLCADGDRVASFYLRDMQIYSKTSVAFLTGDRLAVAAPCSLQVYKLPMGQSEGRLTPETTLTGLGQRAVGVVTVNPAGTKLAFLPACGSDIFLYDAHTTVPLDTLQLAGCTLPPECLDRGLVWGVYSWIVSDYQQYDVDSRHRLMRALQVFKPQRGCSSCSELLKREGQPNQEPACSPDGRFVCLVCHSDDAGITVGVHDTVIGKVMLTQAIGSPDDVQQRWGVRNSMAIWWSSCGSRLLVRTIVWTPGRTSNYLTVLQF